MKSLRKTSALITFGANVKKFRIHKKWTQEKLAETILTSAVQIGRIEAGKNACTITVLLNICTALNVTPNDLFEGIDLLPSFDNNTVFSNRFISSHSIQSPETKELVRHFMNFFELKQKK